MPFVPSNPDGRGGPDGDGGDSGGRALADRAFERAGDAACLLEDMGFVAVARRRDQVVLLEFWKMVAGEQRLMRHVVPPDVGPADTLARDCALRFNSLAAGHES